MLTLKLSKFFQSSVRVSWCRWSSACTGPRSPERWPSLPGWLLEWACWLLLLPWQLPLVGKGNAPGAEPDVRLDESSSDPSLVALHTNTRNTCTCSPIQLSQNRIIQTYGLLMWESSCTNLGSVLAFSAVDWFRSLVAASRMSSALPNLFLKMLANSLGLATIVL